MYYCVMYYTSLETQFWEEVSWSEREEGALNLGNVEYINLCHYLQGFRVKEDLGCVLFCAVAARKNTQLSPSLTRKPCIYELISAQEYVRGPNQALRKKRQDEGFRGKKIQADTAPASPAAAVCTNSLVIIQSKSVTSPSLRLWFLFRAAVCCWKAGWRMDMEWADFKWGHQISSILGYTGCWSN